MKENMVYTKPSGVGFIDPNFPNPNGPNDASIIIYGYTPNFTLCILGIVLFAIAFVLHLIQVIIYRLWSFTPLTIACILEVVGYAFRSLSSHKDPYRITYFVVQYFLIVTAPVLISASIYVCLTRIMAGAELNGTDFGNRWWMKKKFILWTFIIIDAVTTAMQVIGAGLIGAATSKQKDPKTANYILLSGLVIQSAAFLVFLTLLSVVIVTICKNSALMKKIYARKNPFIVILLISSILIFARTLFRMAETSEGVFGHLSTHEAFFGGLEFAPMVIAVFLLEIWHPGRWMSNTEREERKTSNV
jgi:hypothetical protein